MAMTEEEQKEQRRKYQAEYRKKHPERVRDTQRRCRKKTADHCNAYMRDYYAKNKDKYKEYQEAYKGKDEEHFISVRRKAEENYKKRHPGAVNKNYKRWRDRNRDAVLMDAKQERVVLDDVYVKHLLCQKNNLSAKHIPQWLIDLKREHIKITRILKERKQNG
jgi:hypothetical protein